jgi:hypothetical protein
MTGVIDKIYTIESKESGFGEENSKDVNVARKPS